jgi:signal transduction histidine kinase
MSFAPLDWPHSFRGRLLVVYVAGMVLSASLVGLGVMVLAEPFWRYMLRYSVIDNARALSERVQFDASHEPIGLDASMQGNWVFASLNKEVALRITDARGAVYYSGDGGTTSLTVEGERFDPSKESFVLVRDGVSMHVATVPLQRQGATWFLQFAVSDRMVLLLRQSIGLPALHQGILATCLTFLVIFLISMQLTLRRVLKPLLIVSEQAQRITPQSMHERLELRDLPSELRPLVDAFNNALDRLQTGFQTQQDFLANAAHELKTPLALIRGQVELAAPHEQTPYLLQDIDRMARQVHQLLHLAEASEHRNYRMEACDPRGVILEAVDFLDRVAKRSGVQLSTEFLEDSQLWVVDRGALFTLVKNLLENAIQHSPRGGVVRLKLHARGFVVSDQGPGVAPEDLNKLFDRFWRGASRRDESAGLGLSICQEIVRAHAWRMNARSEPSGLEMHVLDASVGTREA